MHTHKTLTVLCHCLRKAGVSLKEQRLIYATRENPEAPAEGGNRGNERGRSIDNQRGDTRDQLNRASGGAVAEGRSIQDDLNPQAREGNRRQRGATEGAQSVSQTIHDRHRGERQREDDETRGEAARSVDENAGRTGRIEDTQAGSTQRSADEERGRSTREAQATTNGASRPGLLKRMWDSPLRKDTAIVGGATGATIGAASYASELAAIHPYLGAVGSFAESIVGGLGTTLGAVPAWTIPAGLGAGLWTLGKVRAAHLKTTWAAKPDSEEKQRELERLAKLGLIGNMSEGVKLIGGGIARATRFIPVGIGKISGTVENLTTKFFKKMGGIPNLIKWPWKNKKHLAWGGAGAIGAGALTSGLATAGSVALGPAAIPLAVLIGGVAAYRRSKHGKSKGGGSDSPELALGGT